MRYLLWMIVAINLFAVDAKLTIEKDVEQRAKIVLEDDSLLPKESVRKIFLSDLEISGHFLPNKQVREGDFRSNSVDASLKSQEYLLKFDMQQENGTKLSVRLLQISDGKELFKKSYAIASYAKMPFLIHKAIYDINRALKFPDIGWINRYVIFSRYTTPKHSEIVLADYTFTYMKRIIKGGLNLFPHWADPNQRSFYYTSLRGGLPTLYRLNIYTGAKTKVATSEGMLVCSDVSKDAKRILLTMAPQGQPDIYELDLTTGSKRRITRFNGIDVNGKYLDDESRIVFVSNRLGYANIFQKPVSGNSVSQVVYHGKNNNAVDAYGTKIVYASRESKSAFKHNRFNLYLSDVDDMTSRPLTTTGSNQFPRFSSDGKIVQYIKQTHGGSSIGYINLDTKRSLLFPFYGKKIQAIDW